MCDFRMNDSLLYFFSNKPTFGRIPIFRYSYSYRYLSKKKLSECRTDIATRLQLSDLQRYTSDSLMIAIGLTTNIGLKWTIFTCFLSFSWIYCVPSLTSILPLLASLHVLATLPLLASLLLQAYLPFLASQLLQAFLLSQNVAHVLFVACEWALCCWHLSVLAKNFILVFENLRNARD